MKFIYVISILLLSLRISAAEVLTWVPPYSIPQSYAMLNRDFGGIGMKDGLTRLALQFWRPTMAGKIEIDSRYGDISDDAIKKFGDWAKANKIALVLCIYNPPPSQGKPWEWSRAQAAFNQPDAFIDSIVSEITRLGESGIEISGVDMDLESSTTAPRQDKAKYIAMMKALSLELKKHGKFLSVATYASKWNAPNIEYWPELTPFIDGISPMAYERMGYQVKCEKMFNHGDDWCTYGAMLEAVGSFDKRLLTLGMPGNVQYKQLAESWLGKSVLEHLEGVRILRAGVAIWDANLHPSWQNAEVWKTLREIKHGRNIEASSAAPDSFFKMK